MDLQTQTLVKEGWRMNVIQKYIILWLGAYDKKPCTPLEVEWGLRLLARIDDFKELRDYINKLEEPIRP